MRSRKLRLNHMLLPHNKVSGGVQDSQIMIPSFFDRFYVMPPLTNGVHYNGDFSVFYVNALTSLFQVSSTEKADILFVFSPENLLLCGLPHQKAESLHVVCDVA